MLLKVFALQFVYRYTQNQILVNLTWTGLKAIIQ